MQHSLPACASFRSSRVHVWLFVKLSSSQTAPGALARLRMAAQGPDGAAAELEALLEQDEATRVGGGGQTSRPPWLVLGPLFPPRRRPQAPLSAPHPPKHPNRRPWTRRRGPALPPPAHRRRRRQRASSTHARHTAACSAPPCEQSQTLRRCRHGWHSCWASWVPWRRSAPPRSTALATRCSCWTSEAGCLVADWAVVPVKATCCRQHNRSQRLFLHMSSAIIECLVPCRLLPLCDRCCAGSGRTATRHSGRWVLAPLAACQVVQWDDSPLPSCKWRPAAAKHPNPVVPRAQAAAAADAEEEAHKQAAALQQRLALLSGKLSEVEEERRAELAPSLRAARDDVALLRRCDGCRACRAAGCVREHAHPARKAAAPAT